MKQQPVEGEKVSCDLSVTETWRHLCCNWGDARRPELVGDPASPGPAALLVSILLKDITHSTSFRFAGTLKLYFGEAFNQWRKNQVKTVSRMLEKQSSTSPLVISQDKFKAPKTTFTICIQNLITLGIHGFQWRKGQKMAFHPTKEDLK